MSMPISDRALAALAGAVLIGGCSSSQPVDNRALAEAEANQSAAAEDDGRVLCAQGTAPLTRSCTVEQASTPRGFVLTLRSPDGGFHRLLATRDGRGLVAADGAVPAKVTIVDADLIEVRIGDERYRLPATIKR